MNEHQLDLTRLQQWVREASDRKWSWHRISRDAGKSSLPELVRELTKTSGKLEEGA